MKKAYEEYIGNIFDDTEKESYKKFWKFINSQKKDAGSIPTLKTSNGFATASAIKAEELNKQYRSVFIKEDTAGTRQGTKSALNNVEHHFHNWGHREAFEQSESSKSMWSWSHPNKNPERSRQANRTNTTGHRLYLHTVIRIGNATRRLDNSKHRGHYIKRVTEMNYSELPSSMYLCHYKTHGAVEHIIVHIHHGTLW